MGTTPVFGFPYPEGSDPPAGHTQIQALAEAVESTISVIQHGTGMTTQSSGTSEEATVVFPKAFTSVPGFSVDLYDTTFSAFPRINSLTATGFTVRFYRDNGDPFPARQKFTWLAIGAAA